MKLIQGEGKLTFLRAATIKLSSAEKGSGKLSANLRHKAFVADYLLLQPYETNTCNQSFALLRCKRGLTFSPPWALSTLGTCLATRFHNSKVSNSRQQYARSDFQMVFYTDF
jgi:hypothetical protein